MKPSIEIELEAVRLERSRLQECWRGRPVHHHVNEIKAGLQRRLDADPSVRARNRTRVRFHIRLLKARGLSPMRPPARF